MDIKHVITQSFDYKMLIHCRYDAFLTKGALPTTSHIEVSFLTMQRTTQPTNTNVLCVLWIQLCEVTLMIPLCYRSGYLDLETMHLLREKPALITGAPEFGQNVSFPEEKLYRVAFWETWDPFFFFGARPTNQKSGYLGSCIYNFDHCF